MKKSVGVLLVFSLMLFVFSASFASAGFGEALCDWFGWFCKDVRQAPVMNNIEPMPTDGEEGGKGGSSGAVCGDTDDFCSAGQTNDCTTSEGYNGTASCLSDCSGFGDCVTAEYCGDGVENGAEECDDENTEDGDGCSSTCFFEIADIGDSCYDSDEGQDFTAAGYIQGNNSGINYTYYDECIGELINEYYCYGEMFANNQTNCEEGYFCSEGACLENVTYFVEAETNGTINITSNPSGANIYDNSFIVGTTPKVYETYPGNHEITLMKEGYNSETRNINLESGEVESLSVTLNEIEEGNGTEQEPDLIITSFTANVGVLTSGFYPVRLTASIKNNGEVIADESVTRFSVLQINKDVEIQTPKINESRTVIINITINLSSAGSYNASVIADYDEDVSESNESNNEKHIVFNIIGSSGGGSSQNNVSNSTGTLNISSNPSGAEIEDNGVQMGFTPRVYSANAGTHSIILRKEGYTDYSRTVEVRSGSTISLNAVLEEIETCIDSDEGQNYLVAGESTGETGNLRDYCVSKEILKEFYCAEGEVREENKDCTELGEYKCNEGACVSPEETGFFERILEWLKENLGL